MEHVVTTKKIDEWQVSVLRSIIELHPWCYWRVQWKRGEAVLHEVVATSRKILSGNVPEINVVDE